MSTATSRQVELDTVSHHEITHAVVYLIQPTMMRSMTMQPSVHVDRMQDAGAPVDGGCLSKVGRAVATVVMGLRS